MPRSLWWRSPSRTVHWLLTARQHFIATTVQYWPFLGMGSVALSFRHEEGTQPKADTRYPVSDLRCRPGGEVRALYRPAAH
jgi:hypothetical protein